MAPGVIVVGEQPNGEVGDEGALARSRLPEYAGITAERFLRHPRQNLLPRGGWSRPAARASAALLLAEDHDVFVLCGRRVADAFAVPGGWLSLVPIPAAPDRRALLIPHPSGRCRVWNDEGFRRRARAVLSLFL